MKKLVLIEDNLDDVSDSDEEKYNNKSNEGDSDEEEKENQDEVNLNPFLRKSISNLPIGMAKQFDLFKQMVSTSTETLAKRISVGPEQMEIATIPSLENIRGFLGTKFVYEKIRENKYKP